MRSARWRKVRADLLSSRLRSGLAILSLAVGTAAVGAMFLAGSTVQASFDANLAAANPPAAVVITDPFPPELVAEVGASPLVGRAEGRRLHQVQMTDAGGDRVGVTLVALDDFAGNRTARIAPLAGDWPPAPGSIVLERASARELGFETGERAIIDRGAEGHLALTVGGSALDVFEVAPMVGGPLRGYVAMETMARLTGSQQLNAFYLSTAAGAGTRDQAVAMAGAVRDGILTPAGVPVLSSRIDEPGEHPADNAVTFITLAMQMLSVLALLIAVGLVVNTVSALIAQQQRQVGVMKAVGGTTAQLSAQYLAYVLLLAAVAIALAVPAGLAGGRLVAGFLADLVNIDLEPMGVPVAAIALQVGIAVLVPIAAVVLSVRRACRTTVREAITDRGLDGGGPARTRSSRIPRPTVLAYRNAVRNRLRLGLTVLTVSLSGAVLLGVINTGSAMGDLVDGVAGYDDYDLAIGLTERVPLADVVDAVGDDEAVGTVEGWRRGEAVRHRPDGTENDGIDLLGVPAGSRHIDPTLLEGRWIEAGDEDAIVINTHLADAEPDLAVGGEVVLEVEGRRRAWSIVGISSTTLVGPVAYVPGDGLAAALGTPGRADLIVIGLTPGADAGPAVERLGALALEAGLPVGTITTGAELRAANDGLAAIVVVLLLLVGGILAVVAVIGLTGTMTLGVIEQTREIGVLRTLGASTWTVRRLLLVQGLAIAAVGGLAGVVLSIPVSLLLGGAIGTTLISAAFPFSFSWLGVAIWAVVALTIGALGAIQPARVAARLTIRDTLAYE